MRYLRILKRLSFKSNHHSHHIACLIVRSGKIIGRGYNMIKTHPHSPHKNYKQIHAEFAAVLNAEYDVKGAIAYIFRQTKDGTPAVSKPCASCHQFLVEQGIVEIVYSIEGSYKEEKLA